LFGLNWRTGCDGLVQFASGAKSATILGMAASLAYGAKALIPAEISTQRCVLASTIS